MDVHKIDMINKLKQVLSQEMDCFSLVITHNFYPTLITLFRLEAATQTLY